MKSITDFVSVHQAEDYPDLMSSRQVCRAAKITYRMLDYWVRADMVSPVIASVGSGSARLFDPSVVDQIVEMRQRAAACPYKHR